MLTRHESVRRLTFTALGSSFWSLQPEEKLLMVMNTHPLLNGHGGLVVDALDEEVKEPRCLDEMCFVFKLGIICTGTLPSTRPSMKEVLNILKNTASLTSMLFQILRAETYVHHCFRENDDFHIFQRWS